MAARPYAGPEWRSAKADATRRLRDANEPRLAPRRLRMLDLFAVDRITDQGGESGDAR